MIVHTYGTNVADFTVGTRVELHPATDAWMQGDRFGTVSSVGRKYVRVTMDRSGRVLGKLPMHVRTLTD